jgi:HEAT repeat protein
MKPITRHILLLVCLALWAPLTPAQTLDELTASTREKYEQIITGGQFPKELTPLQSQLQDKSAAVRIKAVQALSLVGSPMSALLLMPAMDDDIESDPAVRIEAARGLGDIGGRQALEILGIGVTDKDAAVRKRVVESLRWAGTVFAVPYIQLALRDDRTVGVRLQAVRMLRKIGTQFSIQPLHESLLTDRDPTIRKAAADALGEIGKKERQVARYLGEAYPQERNIGVKVEIIDSLGQVLDRAGLPYLQEAMKDRNTSLRMRATHVYGRVMGLQ